MDVRERNHPPETQAGHLSISCFPLPEDVMNQPQRTVWCNQTA